MNTQSNSLSQDKPSPQPHGPGTQPRVDLGPFPSKKTLRQSDETVYFKVVLEVVLNYQLPNPLEEIQGSHAYQDCEKGVFGLPGDQYGAHPRQQAGVSQRNH